MVRLMPSPRTLRWTIALSPVVLLVAVVAAWAIDTGVASGSVLRNVELAGRDVGGMTEAEVTAAVDRLAGDYEDTLVTIESAGATYETTAGALGLAVDSATTVENTLEVGRSQFVLARPIGWLGSLFSPRQASVAFTIDETKVRDEVVALEGDRRTAPVEPELVAVEGAVEATDGEPGSGIEAPVLAEALLAEADRVGIAPLSVSVRPGPIPPRITDEEAHAVAAEATELTSTPLTVNVGEQSAELAPATQRGWVSSVVNEGELELVFDVERIRATISETFADAGRPAVDASFVVEGNVPRLVPGQTGLGCCAEDTGDRVLAALRGGESSVELDFTEVEPDLTTEEAEGLGIVAEVGSPTAFGPTTEHACCQNRVTNIHRIADIVRGAVIRPGETFSVNDYVGRRTREKGFVADGVIYNGVYTEDVGGGVSQFATTLFNAALYAGLDFGEYQSHSLYISRYPRGHEATISYPAPDLEIVNDSEYGVLLWPTYTDTSITVHIYSTPHIIVEVGEPRSSPAGNCTRWTTPRTRTYADGRVVEDSVSARYRPREGVNC